MGAETKIEWTDATWNPWHGCRKVSPGCGHCYMFRDKKRFGQDPTIVVRSAEASFQAPRRWRAPRRVFTCSWSDFFITDADRWRSDAWEVIRETPHHTYQILTKRPERVREHIPWSDEPWPNVWLIVSAEDQKHLEDRWRLIAGVPAIVRGLSIEPLLGPIDLTAPLRSQLLSWVIVGGESGPHARAMDASWVRTLRDQCVEAGVPFFFKQWGGVFKKKTGRHLDGRTWDDVPHSAAP
jgi:protein gp37